MSTPSEPFVQPSGRDAVPARRFEYPSLWSRMQATDRSRYVIVLRAIAGLPLLGIGLMHLVSPAHGMTPLVEEAGFPLPGLLSPLSVWMEIAAGALLLAGFWARLGGLLAFATMLGAVYAHLAIEVWPNEAEGEPPLALPIVVGLCAVYVMWRGAGRWSLDARHTEPGRSDTAP